MRSSIISPNARIETALYASVELAAVASLCVVVLSETGTRSSDGKAGCVDAVSALRITRGIAKSPIANPISIRGTMSSRDFTVNTAMLTP
jgi:hypothetical protein